MIRKKQTRQHRGRKERYVINRQIRFPEVRVLDSQGEVIDVMPTVEALERAQAEHKDLVLVTDQAKPPVVKIIDLAKHKYQQQQREAANRKSARKQDLKEVRFTPFMGEGDFESRLKKVVGFLENGDKVRLSLQFKGRQITKKEFGYDLFNKVIEHTKEIAKVETEPKLMGKKLLAQLTPSN